MASPRKPASQKKPTGRPTKYTPELAERILQHVRDGGWVEDFNEMPEFPHKSTVYQWTHDDTTFGDAYARAVAERAHFYVRKGMKVSEDDSKDIYITPDGDTRVSHAAVQRSKLQCDTYKWLAEKHCPRVYGPKMEQEISGKGGLPVMPVIEIIHRTGKE